MKKWLKKNRFMLVGALLGVLLAGIVVGLSIAFPGSVLLLPWIWFEGLSLVNMVLVSAGVIVGTGVIVGAIGKGIDVFGATIVNKVVSLLSNAWNSLFSRKDGVSTVSSTPTIKPLRINDAKLSSNMNEPKLMKDSRSNSSSLSTHSTPSSSPRPVSLASHSVLAPSNQVSRSRASSNSEESNPLQKSLKDILKALNEIDNGKPGWQGEIVQLRKELLQMKQEAILEGLKQQGKDILNGLVEKIKKQKPSSKEIEELLNQTIMKKLRVMFHPDQSGNNELAHAIANQIEGWWDELKQALQKVDDFSVSEWISKMKAEQTEIKEAFKQYEENVDEVIEKEKELTKSANEFFAISDQYGKKVDATVKLAEEVLETKERYEANVEILKRKVANLAKAVQEETMNSEADETYQSAQSHQSVESASKQRRKTW